MALELVTGPANAEKAGAVLARVRALAGGGSDPILVVPTGPDALAFRRELAADGLVFGVRVETFNALRREIAERTGVTAGAAPEILRRRVAQAAIAATRLEALAQSASTRGFAAAFAGLCGELAEARIGPGLWYTAMRAWGAAEPGRAAYAEELAALYGAYRDRVTPLGGDPATRDFELNDALRLAPLAWAAVPVLFYGFDDLTPTQLDTIRTLVEVGADVVVSLPYEDGRDDIYRARSRTLGELLELAGERHVRLAHGEEEVAALGHLERALFTRQPQRPDPGDAVTLLAGGGERAELELIAETARAAIAGGTPPEEIAVALRDARSAAPLVERVFSEAGVPIALERRVPVAHTALGRTLIALLAVVLPGGSAEDLLTWLRVPGRLEQPELADVLERTLRRGGIQDAEGAHGAWERTAGFRFGELDELSALAGDPVRFCERLAVRAEELLMLPWRGTGAILPPASEADARALRVVRSALTQLARLGRDEPALAPDPASLGALLGEQEVWVGREPAPGLVTVADPLRLRARRVRLLLLGRLQEGIFPAAGAADPFLGDNERLAINDAGGLRLRLREDRLDAERWLLYSAVSRPTERLALSWHRGDDDGEPRVRSLFVDDVLDCLDPALGQREVDRRLGEVGVGTEGGGARQRRLAAAAAAPLPAPEPGLGPLTDPDALAEIAARDAWAARTIEQWVACPVRWLVEWLVAPDAIDPDPPPMIRGGMYHRVLQRTFEELRGVLTPAQLDNARSIALGALREECSRRRLSVREHEHAAQVRRLEASVLRYLAFAAESGTVFRPAHFELSFGTSRDERDPVQLAPGLRLSGRIDRIDVSLAGDDAIVIDYKGATGGTPQARWGKDGDLQAGLYALALPQLLPGTRVAGALYQPVGARDQRPRGYLLDDVDADRGDIVRHDRLDASDADELLAEVLRKASKAVDELREGKIVPRPDGCGYRTPCAHPSICRCTP